VDCGDQDPLAAERKSGTVRSTTTRYLLFRWNWTKKCIIYIRDVLLFGLKIIMYMMWSTNFAVPRLFQEYICNKFAICTLSI